MTTNKHLAALATLLAIGFVFVDLSIAADGGATRRESVKARPRFFNPFDISASRLTLSPFGLFPVAEAPAGEVADAPPAPTRANGALDDSQPANEDLVVAFRSVRPPYRPTVRSPFRPAPHPPF